MTVRELNGWAPASVTYGADGEILSTTVQEPRFTPIEKAILLASRRDSLALRGTHGHLISEATDPANQFAYKVSGPITDWAQAKVAQAQEQYRKNFPDADMSALFWPVDKI